MLADWARGLGMLILGYLAVFLSARIVKLYEGGYTVEYEEED